MDPLCCHEEPWEQPEVVDDHPHHPHHLHQIDEQQCWEILSSLLAKEAKPRLFEADGVAGGDGYLGSAREKTVAWVARASARLGFLAATVLLAVEYLDRCFLPSGAGGLRLQSDKPWMARLSAVACLSLAAKVEEIRVPPLLDLQAVAAAGEEAAPYMFEPRTVRRMELLVLATLGWRMNPVTPLSFVELLITDRSDAVKCNAALLSVIADWRWVRHPPSAWAAAVLLHAAAGQEHLLNVPKKTVEECYDVILERVVSARHKRKCLAVIPNYHYYSCYHCPASPSAVLGSCFSCESSSVPSSPEQPPPKRPNCSEDEDEK